MCDAREHDAFIFQKIDKIICSCLAFDIGRERENNFGKFFFLNTGEKLVDAQIFRPDVIERRNAAA